MVAVMLVRSDLRSNLEALASQVAETFVHRLFPSYRDSFFLACPDEESAAIVLKAITRAAKSKGVTSEGSDLRSAPADVLDAITARLHDLYFLCRGAASPPIARSRGL